MKTGALLVLLVVLQIAMAENNGRVIWSHGANSWDRNHGVRVYKTVISEDGELTTYKVSMLQQSKSKVQGYSVQSFCNARYKLTIEAEWWG